MRRTTTLRAAVCGALLTLAAAGPATAQTWQEVPNPTPPGARVTAPVGFAGDLEFWAPNRGVLTTTATNAYSAGIFVFDGAAWRQLATVCGIDPNVTQGSRVAWAGPTELWVISQAVRLGRSGGLCHVKDGEVVGSYSTPDTAAAPHRRMYAAECNGPNDCWFAGEAVNDARGVGAFHLHWDGAQLTQVHGRQGRGISALEHHQGTLYESTLVGSAPERREPPVLAEPETGYPRLLHRFDGTSFVNVDAFRPAALPGLSENATELRDLESDGTSLWAVGGGAASGPASSGGFARRPPYAAVLSAGTWRELTTWTGTAPTDLAITQVAPVPGTDTAWGVLRAPDRNHPDSQPRPTELVFLDADGSSGTQLRRVTVLGRDGLLRGNAMQIACPTASDCWAVTDQGFFFRLGGGSYALDVDPAFANLITFRPDEGAEAFIPDNPPEDDSAKFAPPPLEVQPPAEPPQAAPERVCRRTPARYSNVKRRVRDRTKLVVSFRLTTTARVRLVAKRGTRVVAKTKLRRLRKGARTLSVRLSTRRWPTKIELDVRGPKPKAVVVPCADDDGGGDAPAASPDDVVTTR